MTMPYKVIVRAEKKTGLHIDVVPFPIATTEAYLPIVVRTIQSIITQVHMNTIGGRAKLKQQLETVIADFHAQGMIKPKD